MATAAIKPSAEAACRLCRGRAVKTESQWLMAKSKRDYKTQYKTMYRSNTCGELRATNIGQTVTLAGWVQKIRNLGAMTFIDLRDRYGITQIVVEEHSDEATKEAAAKLGRECVIQVVGRVIELKVVMITDA